MLSLAEWLYRYGYNRADAEAAEAAFNSTSDITFKATAAAATFEWADDDEHDYSGEMLGCIAAWLLDGLEELKQKLQWHERGCPQGTVS